MASPSSSDYRDLLTAVPPPEVWTSDFVIRSLRRRLWKAFQEDDGETALRAYQASLNDFEGWLHEEEEQYWKMRDAMDSKSSSKAGSKRGSIFKRRSSKDASWIASNVRDMKRGTEASKSSVLEKLACKPEKDHDLISEEAKATRDLRQLNNGPILQSHINPSEPFIADDFLSPYESYDTPAQKMLPDPQKREREKELRKKKSRRGPRLAAFNVFKKDQDPMCEMTIEENESESVFAVDPSMTTPLHEASRLGSGDFLRILLANGGDPNVKNGNSRTALHMCSGGVTKEEENLIAAGLKKKKKTTKNLEDDTPPGLHAPSIPSDILALMNSDLKKAAETKGKARKAVKKVGKILSSALGPSTKDLSQNERTRQNQKKKVRANPSRLNHISTERMDAVLALLSWIQPETGEGPSLNAVDVDGRTALHYAAETGRTDVCMAILSNFGAMLTVIDEIGARTPCELAAHRGHDDLAAQLEARALLYIDPYGLDDELMASVLTGMADDDDEDWNPRSHLAAPFNWFSTETMSQVVEERTQRLADAAAKLQKAIALYEGARDMKSVMAKAAKVGLDAAIDANEEGAVDTATADNKKGSMSALMESAEKFGLDAALGRTPLKSPDGHDAEIEDDSSKKPEAQGGVLVNASVEDEKKALENMKEVHVERYLSHHNWNVAEALKQFRKKPVEALKKAGISLPDPSPDVDDTEKGVCLICYDDDVQEKEWVNMSWCGHGFCRACLKDYLKDCAASKSAVATITCPHHECKAGIPQSEIDRLLSDCPETLARIIEANAEQFVTSAEDYKFCTHPGCEGVVRRIPQPFLVSNGIDLNLMNHADAVCIGIHPEKPQSEAGYILTYEGVDDPEYNNCRSQRQPKRAHRFCFACGEGPHWPVPCERLEEWKKKMKEQIKEVEKEEGDENNANANDVAQRLWIKANTRPCPKCNVPIEKNDGCNHMTCTNPNCRHEFCWICRKDWKLHGTATGGFFRCNIWQEEGEGSPEAEKIPEVNPRQDANNETDAANDQSFGTAIYSSRAQYRERQEMARFLHHYTRWEAHGDSARLERKMAEVASSRLAPVVEAATEFDGSPNFNFGGKGLSFVHSAFMELQESRAVLKHSYAFSFFRYPAFCQVRRYSQLTSRRREKMTFESLQSELEMMTEQMSDVVARSHLRATQVQIMFLTSTTADKREEFSNLMFSILNDEKREARKSKSLKPVDASEARSARRYRNNTPSLSSPLGGLGRVVDDTLSSDADEVVDNELRTAIEEYMARAVPLDPPERAAVDAAAGGVTRMWACSACTYMNSGGSSCAICGSMRS